MYYSYMKVNNPMIPSDTRARGWSRPRRTNIAYLLVGVMVGSVVGLGGAMAATTSQQIVACANKSTGVMRYAKNGRCTRNETRIRWNQQGQPGAMGATGPAGPAGGTGPAGAPGSPGADAVLPAATCATGGTCAIGDTGPGGGTVFYVAQTRQAWGRYLEAAPTGWYGTQDDPNLGWCASSTNWANDTIHSSVPGGAQGTTIGDGWKNSVNIAKHCPYGAATTARMYRGGALTDWYLPSLEEVTELYNQRAVVGGLGTTNRWSSSESMNLAADAWRKFFNAVGANEGFKEFDNAVRPIRAFG